MHHELLSFINKFIYLDEVDSTNLEAKRLLKKQSLPGNSIIISECQTMGRGRGGNVWWSGKKSLLFTLILSEASSQVNFLKIPLVIGLSVQKILQYFLPEKPVEVKWPNDVLVKSRKVCGILCENERDIENKTRIIAGVGVNVNDSMINAPEEIRLSATSLYDELGREVNNSELLFHILLNLKDDLDNLYYHGFGFFMERWNECDYLKKRFVKVEYPEHSVCGHAVGVGKNGNLRLMVGSGIREISSGSVNVL